MFWQRNKVFWHRASTFPGLGTAGGIFITYCFYDFFSGVSTEAAGWQGDFNAAPKPARLSPMVKSGEVEEDAVLPPARLPAFARLSPCNRME